MAGRPPPSEIELHEAIDWINQQPDALTAIVKYKRPDLKGNLGYLHVGRLDDYGKFLQIQIHPPPTHEEKEIQIPLDPPILSSFDLRPLFYKWRAEAFSLYRVPTNVQINYYERPAWFPFTAPALIAMSVLFFSAWGTGHYADLLREKIEFYLGPHMIKFGFGLLAFFHLAFEPAYMFWLTGKHKVPFGPRVKWILTNMAVGFGAINEFHECVMYERLRLVYKQTDVGDIGPRNKGSEEVTAEKKKQ
ncbi:hypothetical protein Q8F55_002877 [Vanrija albida]|uniref:DUF2470 domain-containing protein n=1 Tax=Vanrija albida TaxID=181172 RepID=A0ABR3QB20_9TREE